MKALREPTQAWLPICPMHIALVASVSLIEVHLGQHNTRKRVWNASIWPHKSPQTRHAPACTRR